MLDDARVKAGLPSATEVEFRAQHQRRQLAAAVKGANDPRPLRVALTDAGTLVERDDEIARDHAQEESHRHAREDREAERAEWARREG